LTRGLGTWLFPILLTCPLGKGFCFLACMWDLSFGSSFSPFVGCFILINFNKVSSSWYL
jgi:hypothetical protein